ncbi:MAG: ABC transporter transmembrane domain-containing protein, partial [Candidatus Nitrotoga sp.]
MKSKGSIISAPTSHITRRLSSLRDLLPFLRPYRKQVLLAFLLLSFASATVLILPLAFRDLVDFSFGQVKNPDGTLPGGALISTQSLDGHFAVLFGLASLWALTVAARYYMVSWVGERVTVDLRSAVYARVLRQSPQFFETLQTGEVLSRLTGDTILIQTVVGSSISMGLRSLFQFIGGMVMLAVTSLYLFSLNLGLMILLTLPIILIGRRVRKLSRESQDKIADSSALAGEILNAVPTVQAYTQEERETQRFADSAELSFIVAIRRIRVRAFLTALIITAVMGAIIFVLWVGANQVREGSMTIGELASFILYAALVAGGVGTMAEVWGDLMRAAGATERLLELLRAESAIQDPAVTKLGGSKPGGIKSDPAASAMPQTTPQMQVAIRFEQVSFRYPSRLQTAALNNISLDIAPGESVALIGPSGAGKTTLFQLLLRFYDVSEGIIHLNGQDIRQLALHDLRDKIAIVPQDAVIFSA